VECCEVHGVVCVVASFDPHFAFFHKEASAMEDTNADINNVFVGDGMLGELDERRATEEACNEQLEAHRGMPLMAIAVRFVLQSLADVWPYFITNQPNSLWKTELGFSIQICS